MKRLLIPLLATLALPTAVNAEVIYLECSFDGYMGEMEFALNERKMKVTYTNENGTSWTNPASFTNKRIFFGDDISELVVRSFLIDRTNGDIVVQITVGDNDKVPGSQKGKCKKTQTMF